METSKKILLVEDDPNFGMVLKSYLEINGFPVTHKADGFQGMVAFKKDKFDLCILDVMMPVMDGFTLASEIRKLDMTTPLLFLTAKNLKEDVLRGYSLGADDYIVKPFDTDIFLYKVKAILKRNQHGPGTDDFPTEFKIGKYIFNHKIRTLSFDGAVQKMSPKESELFKLLCINKNDVMPREEALLKIWKADNYFTTRSMDVFIARLRKYLKDDTSVRLTNVHGNGYMLSFSE